MDTLQVDARGVEISECGKIDNLQNATPGDRIRHSIFATHVVFRAP